MTFVPRMSNDIAHVGQRRSRVEDDRLLRGRGRYLDDLDVPNQVFGVVVYAPHAHARIRSIDAAASLALPGVLCVLTGAALARQGIGGLPPLFMPSDAGGPPGYATRRPVLALETTRHVGDRVAFCVAETAAAARSAAEALNVDYEVFAAVVDLENAMTSGSPDVWPEAVGNVCFTLRFGDVNAADAAFASADHVVSMRLCSSRISAVSLEPRCAIGFFDASNDSYVLHTSTQNPHRVRETLARDVLHVAEADLRVIAGDVGGGFGMKGDTYPEEALVLIAARMTGRPVRWVVERSDAFVLDNGARDQRVEASMALDRDGRILALRAKALQNLGAYVAGAAIVPIVFSLKTIPSLYRVGAVDFMTKAVFTHTAPTCPYRGAGRPEGIYVMERLLERAAVEMGKDPVALRRLNLIEPEALPYRSACGLVYDSGDFPALVAAGVAGSAWDDYAERRRRSKEQGRLRGRALNCYIQDTGTNNERMELRFDPSGTLSIIAGTFSHGQSHATTYAQCVSDWLGIPFHRIRLVQGDTAKVAYGRGTYASGSAILGGNALRVAADRIIAKGQRLAAALLAVDADDVAFDDGLFRQRGSNRSITFADVVRAAFSPVMLPAHGEIGLEATGSFAAGPSAFPSGCHVCEVEVDPDTGVVIVDRYLSVDDFGTLINPMVVEGQVHGAIAQGIGQALGEHFRYGDDGQAVTSSLLDYAVPRAADLPSFDTRLQGVACRTNPLGVKGAGEGGCVAAPPAVINAILDALQEHGVRHIDMPATPFNVWKALKASQAEHSLVKRPGSSPSQMLAGDSLASFLQG